MSEHFAPHEFACPCCGISNVDPDLIAALEQFRVDAGDCPVIISSACRCPRHNAAVRGEGHSRHLTTGLRACDAADIRVAGLTLAEMYFVACKVSRFSGGGIGIYLDKGFVHVDCRPGRARWGHLGGKYVPFVDAWGELEKKKREGLVDG
ncbi:MAG: D-Ala-D-Ala carboxypeptidase family metallohydrolase [Phycisphaerales bacterium]|jgi:uncharacterized protein YcbK (DUF882 family)